MSFDSATGRHKGFCFVEYDNTPSADQALQAMNGFELAGRPIKVLCHLPLLVARPATAFIPPLRSLVGSLAYT